MSDTDAARLIRVLSLSLTHSLVFEKKPDSCDVVMTLCPPVVQGQRLSVSIHVFSSACTLTVSLGSAGAFSLCTKGKERECTLDIDLNVHVFGKFPEKRDPCRYPKSMQTAQRKVTYCLCSHVPLRPI